MSDAITTVRRTNDMYELFADATANEVYECGRMLTVERDDCVQLVGYGNRVYAEIDRSAESVTLFEGHKGTSRTDTRRINELRKVLEDRSVAVMVVGTAPTFGKEYLSEEPTDFIENYIGGFDNLSSVEQEAREEVEERCRKLAEWLLDL